jgi:hypothetical protein
MPWNSPRAWAAGELVTAGNMNTYISDLLTYLKGGAGPITLDSAVSAPTFRGNSGVFSNDYFYNSVGTAGLFNQNTSRGINLPSQGASDYSTGGLFWHSANDGSGSGMDADLVDGLHHEQLSWTVPTAGQTLPVGFDAYLCQTAGTYTLRPASELAGRKVKIKAWTNGIVVAAGSGNNLDQTPSGTLALNYPDAQDFTCYVDGTTWIIG